MDPVFSVLNQLLIDIDVILSSIPITITGFVIGFLSPFFFGFIIIDHLKTWTKIIFLSKHNIKSQTEFNNNTEDKNYDFSRLISIIIPARNEEDNIEKCIDSILNQIYPNKEIIIVNDASSDKTSEILKKYENNKEIHILHRKQSSGSKASVLNYGINNTNGDIIFTIDADCYIPENTCFKKIVTKFEKNKEMIGLSGNIKIEPGLNSKNNFLTNFQSFEYLSVMEIGKRFHSKQNSMLIMPGGFAVFKKKYVEQINPFDETNKSEDFDLSLKLHRFKKNISFSSEAVGIFNCPSTLGGLLQQRKRWSYGFIETLWKNRYILTSPNYSFKVKATIVNMLSFEVILNFFWLVFFFVLLPGSIISEVMSCSTETLIQNNNNIFSVFAENVNCVINDMNLNTKLDLSNPTNYYPFFIVILLLYPINQLILAKKISDYSSKSFSKMFKMGMLDMFFYKPFIVRPFAFYGHLLFLINRKIGW